MSGISPASGPVGTTVTVVGANFGNVRNVVMGSVSAPFTVVSSTQINVTIPTGAATGPITLVSFGCANASSPVFTVTSLVTPPATCSYSLSYTSLAVSYTSSSYSVNVTAGAGCNWTAQSNASWITVTAGASGSGNGTVTYQVAVNPYATGRTGTLTIGGQTLTVSQSRNGVLVRPKRNSLTFDRANSINRQVGTTQ